MVSESSSVFRGTRASASLKLGAGADQDVDVRLFSEARVPRPH